MKTLRIVLLVLAGLIVLLPGLCFVGFGLLFGAEMLSGAGGNYGFGQMAPFQLIIGGLLTWAAIAIFMRLRK